MNVYKEFFIYRQMNKFDFDFNATSFLQKRFEK